VPGLREEIFLRKRVRVLSRPEALGALGASGADRGHGLRAAKGYVPW